jgi:hypothetical protein
MELQDGDFLDLDWSYSVSGTSKKVLVILHGLEGNAQRPYMLGLARHFNQNGWDVAALNFRGCSGEINRLYKSYTAGTSADLDLVISHIISKDRYSSLALNGFSLGGNLMLKYLGEGNKLPTQLKAAVAISAPCDLHGSLKKLDEPKNRIYSGRFVKKLKEQLYLRAKHFPHKLQKQHISACKNLFSIDDLYTSKAHGFENAMEYYQKSSASQFIPNISIPTLLINAKNDNFLSASSSPVTIAQKNPNFYLEMPDHGGHVGFLQNNEQTYTEERALAFIESFI